MSNETTKKYYLDIEGLALFWNKLKEYITNTETQIFDSIEKKVDEYIEQKTDVGNLDKNIEDVAFVVANAIYTIKNTIGADDNLKIHLEGTKHFQECNSLVDAIYKIDNELVPKDELFTILEALFSGMDYGSGGESGLPIGDFEEIEETENIESAALKDYELTQ